MNKFNINFVHVAVNVLFYDFLKILSAKIDVITAVVFT